MVNEYLNIRKPLAYI